WQDGNAPLGEDRVGLERGRPVRAFHDQLRLDAPRVVAGDLVLARREHEHVARQLEQLLVRHAHAFVPGQRSVLLGVAAQLFAAATPPTLRHPWTTQRCSSSRHPSRSHARATTITTPAPVASCRKSEPPSEIGLPVTISGTACPTCIEYVSIIQAIVCSLVAMSGAGMSSCGPMIGSSSEVKRRVRPSISRAESERGSQRTPPFAPPYGSRSSAHFPVIHMASAAHSPSVTCGP